MSKSIQIATYIVLVHISTLFPSDVKATELDVPFPELFLEEFEDKGISVDGDDFLLNDPVPLEPEESIFSVLDGTQQYISSGVEYMAKNIDEFFSSEQALYDTSKSYLKLTQNLVWSEGGESEASSNVSFKLRLPYTKRKLHFTFESNKGEDSTENQAQLENTKNISDEDKIYSAGIQAEREGKNGWKVKTSIGIDLKSTLDLFTRFRLSREFKFNDWSINWQETPYWYNSFGWGFDSSLELNNKITDKDLFRSSLLARWKEETDYFELSQVFRMFHTLSKKKALSYYVGVYGLSEPILYSTHYLIGINYRENIHKDYLFAEIVPQILYQRINDFRPEYSILFRVEMVFKK
ncbi:MAG: hypothetical protein QM484_13420 [Woeseiaceae bacterium]